MHNHLSDIVGFDNMLGNPNSPVNNKIFGLDMKSKLGPGHPHNAAPDCQRYNIRIQYDILDGNVCFMAHGSFTLKSESPCVP